MDMAPPSHQVELSQSVSPRLLGRIQPARRNKLGYAVRGHPDDPLFFVDLSMVIGAKQAAIFIASGAEVPFPEFDVMRVGPVRWPVTSRPATSFVSGGDGPANVGRECPRRSSDVQDFGFGAEDHRDDLRIAE